MQQTGRRTEEEEEEEEEEGGSEITWNLAATGTGTGTGGGGKAWWCRYLPFPNKKDPGGSNLIFKWHFLPSLLDFLLKRIFNIFAALPAAALGVGLVLHFGHRRPPVSENSAAQVEDRRPLPARIPRIISRVQHYLLGRLLDKVSFF